MLRGSISEICHCFHIWFFNVKPTHRRTPQKEKQILPNFSPKCGKEPISQYYSHNEKRKNNNTAYKYGLAELSNSPVKERVFRNVRPLQLTLRSKDHSPSQYLKVFSFVRRNCLPFNPHHQHHHEVGWHGTGRKGRGDAEIQTLFLIEPNSKKDRLQLQIRPVYLSFHSLECMKQMNLENSSKYEV